MLRPNYSAPWCSRQYDFAIKEPRRTVVVRVFAAKDVSIQASYEDGVAYVGSLSVSFKRILRDIHHGLLKGPSYPVCHCVTESRLPLSRTVQDLRR